MPYCRNCGSPIAGIICQRCGWNQTHMRTQPVQQQYQQPQYSTPQKRSKAPVVIGVIIVAAIIILALMFFLVLNPEDEDGIKEMTMLEFVEDYEDSNGDGDIDNLKSFDEGDKVRISDTVSDIYYDDDIDMTLFLCESNEDSQLSFFAIVLDGDRSGQYEIGDPISITWHIKIYEINEKSVELPMEYYSYLLVAGTMSHTTTTPTGALSFTENAPGNYTGGIISLSAQVLLSESSITIIDVSDASSAFQGPLQSGVPIITSGGMTLTFTDTNANMKMDAGDVWTITNGESGDNIKWVHENGKAIAMYTLQ